MSPSAHGRVALETEERRFPNADPSLSYDLAKNELSIQLSSVDALDSKIALGGSLATTLMAILLAFFGIRTGQEADGLSSWSVGLLAGTGGLYLFTLALLILAIRTRTMVIGLTPQDAWDEAERYRTYEDVLYWWATESFIESISHNYQRYQEKLRLAASGFILLGAQVTAGLFFVIATSA